MRIKTYLTRVLKRAGVPPPHLVTVYNALVRSVLEYACPVWSNSLQQYLNPRRSKWSRNARCELFILTPATTWLWAWALFRAERKEGCAFAPKPLLTPGTLPHTCFRLTSRCVATRCAAVICARRITFRYLSAEQSFSKIVFFLQWHFNKLLNNLNTFM